VKKKTKNPEKVKEGNFYFEDIASAYSNDPFGIISSLHDEAYDLIKPFFNKEESFKVLDLPCGTGDMLKRIRNDFPKGQLSALDLSQEMIDEAKKKFPEGGIDFRQGDALKVDEIFEGEKFDMILLHLIFGYVDPNELLNRCKKLLKPNGKISIITSTWESLPQIQKYSFKFYSKEEVQSHAYCPKDGPDTDKIATRAGFSKLNEKVVSKDLHFKNYSEFYKFAHDGGWFTQYFYELPRVYYYIIRAIVPFFFPFDDKLICYMTTVEHAEHKDH
jgi:ubiquinone/menaquinone biosynthesis C-methylase UbiE